MKNYYGNKLIKEAGNSLLECYILKDNNGMYGIELIKNGPDANGASVFNITKEEDEIKNLANILLKNNVLPCTLQNIVEDLF